MTDEMEETEREPGPDENETNEELPENGDVDGSIARATRNAEILEYRLQGHSLKAIAETFDISPARVSQIVKAELAPSDEDLDVARHRRLENMRLDKAQASLWAGVENGNLFSLQGFMAISVRRAKLLGLDMPTKVSVDDSAVNRAADRSSYEAKLMALGEKVRPLKATLIEATAVETDNVAMIEHAGPAEPAPEPTPEHKPIDDFMVDDIYGEAGIF